MKTDTDSDPKTLLQKLASMLGVDMVDDEEDMSGGEGKGKGEDPTDDAATHSGEDEEEDMMDFDLSTTLSAIEESDMTEEEAADAVAEEAGVEPEVVQAVLSGDVMPTEPLLAAMKTVLPIGEGSDMEDTDDAADVSPEFEERLANLEEAIEEKDEQIQRLQKEKEAAERKASRVDNLSEAEEELREREIRDTVQEAAENGRIHAKHADIWAGVLALADDAAQALDTAAIDFADAPVGGEEARDLRESLEYLMNHQGPVVALDEYASADEDADPVDFSDEDSLRHAAKQKQRQMAEEQGCEPSDIRYSEAMAKVVEARQEIE